MRSAVALASFDIAGAFSVNPLAAAVWCAFVGGGLLAGVRAIAGVGLPEPPLSIGWRTRAALVLGLLVNWTYLVLAGA
jgi:hypothetical protein